MHDPKKYLPIAQPFIGPEEYEAVKEPLMSGWLTQGPKTAAFEKAFAQRHQVRHALAATSCTTALHLALCALNIGPGDTVIVPSFTWVATANVVEYCGARPIFCDSRLQDYNLDPERLEELLTGLIKQGLKPKALIAVHLFGLMADMEALGDLAQRFNLQIVEDAACASGAALNGRPAGGWSDVGCFSFHPRKIITTGEGGMCTTNDDGLAAKISSLRSHGATLSEEQRQSNASPFLLPEFKALGFNYRLSDMQGAVGFCQLQRLDGFIAERKKMATRYDRLLQDVPGVRPPACPDGYEHSYQAYVCFLDKPVPLNEVMQHLHERGIGSRPGTHAIHELGYYRAKYGLKPEDFPMASSLARQSLALPLSNHMVEDDLEWVVANLKEIMGRY